MIGMTALHRKLIRDLIHMRGQMFAVTLVLACGIATYVTMRSSFLSLEVAQSDYYSTFRFADVFTHVKRAPESSCGGHVGDPRCSSGANARGHGRHTRRARAWTNLRRAV